MMNRRLARKNIRTGLIVARDLHVHVRHHVRGRRGLRLMSPLDPEVPPVGEEIHLPGPTILPVLTAVGITLVLVGITTFIELTIIGGAADDRAASCAGSKTRAAKSTSSRSTKRSRALDLARLRRPSARRGARAGRSRDRPLQRAPDLRSVPHPTAALAGTGQIAPSSVQQRTTSRTERIPTVSPRSTTIRWRKPPRTIAAAASSSDQSGAAKTTSRVRCSATSSRVGILPRAERDEDVALGDDPRAVAVGIHHDRGAHLRARTSGCATARRVCPGPTVRTVALMPSLHLHLARSFLRCCIA